MDVYYRPIPQTDPVRQATAMPLAGGWCWFDRAERIARDGTREIVPASEIPTELLARLTAPRPSLAGLSLDTPRLMGIVNVTPDSFSDGGRYFAPEAAVAQGRALADAGADILDIGGESTRPGAEDVPVDEEIARTEPIIRAFAGEIPQPISIDTRKAQVAEAALAAGATIVNDVSALNYDPALAEVVAKRGVPVVLMHLLGTPKTMQADPHYDDVLLDVYDTLAERVAAAEAAGIARDRVVIDPGIGFGKTPQHNLELLRGLALFHGLGCPVMLGVSRKRFIAALTGADNPDDRLPGSLAAALAGVAQGVQILRVHDIRETRQALTLYLAATGTGAGT